MRLAYITRPILNPSHFTLLVRAIPWSPEQSYSDMVKDYFMTYYASTYLSHQMVYRSSTVQKLMVCISLRFLMVKYLSFLFFSFWVMRGVAVTFSIFSLTMLCLQNDAEVMCNVFKHVTSEHNSNQNSFPRHLCGVASNPFTILSNETESVKGHVEFDVLESSMEKVRNPACLG